MHLAIIMDGNRRWAEERGLPVLEGHRQGYEKAKEGLKWCQKRGIEILTLYAFSTENWRRPKIEVKYIMKLLYLLLTKDIQELHEKGARFRLIGQKEKLSPKLQELVEKAEELTKNNQKGTLLLAISYGGRAEITEALRKIVKEKIPPDEINEEIIGQHLYTSGLPDPDLIIRTSGEQRISDLLIWQSAYAEFYVCQKYWPDFGEEDLDLALAEFTSRQRRFGK